MRSVSPRTGLSPDRYLDVLSEDMAVFAIPGAKLESYVQRIEALATANAVLSRFHQLRRRNIEAGQTPTVMESLTVLRLEDSSKTNGPES